MNTNPIPIHEHSSAPADRQDLYYKMIEEVEDYAILMLNPNGYIVNWNKGAEKIKGYKASEIVSRHFSIFYSAEDQQSNLPQQLLSIAVKTGKAHHEGWRVRKDGSKFWGSIVLTALHDEMGAVIGFSKVTKDLTTTKIAEDKAKEQTSELAKLNARLLVTKQELEEKIIEINKANHNLEEFAYIASHDLQEPIRKISTYFSMLCVSMEDKFDAKSKALKEKIFSSTNRMHRLINDLLTLSTISDTLALVPVDLNLVIKNVLEDLEMRISDKHARIELEPLPVVAGVESYLVQLFLNLLSNSLKFSNDPPVIRISSINEQGRVMIKIQDNGIGMEEENLSRIFEAFQRLHAKHKYEGTGIGLAICKKIVHALHGKIEVQSQPGAGSTFTISLLPA